MSTMSEFMRLPGFPAVRVCAGRYWARDDHYYVEYVGVADDLIAAGVATTEMCSRPGRSGPKLRCLDADGYPFGRTHNWATTANGDAVLRWHILRYLPRSNAVLLAGGAEAIARYDATGSEERERRARSDHPTYSSGPRVRVGNVIQFPTPQSRS